MTEEQGGEQIGRLWTEIGGDLSPLDAVLDKAAEKLADFIKTEYKAKIGVQFENSGGSRQQAEAAIRRAAGQAARGIGQAAVGAAEQSLKGKTIKDVKVEAKPKIDKDTLTAAIQGSLNGHAFKITIDQNFIREQVQEALGKGYHIGVGGAAAAPGAASQSGGISAEQRAAFDAQFKAHRYSAVGGDSSNLGKMVQDWATQLARIQSRTPGSGGPTAAFEDMLDQLGDDLSTWADKVEAIEPDTMLGDIMRQKFNTTGTLYRDIIAARGGQQSQEQTPASNAFIAQVAKKLVREQAATPSTTAAEVAASKTISELKKVPFFQNRTSLDEIVNGKLDENGKRDETTRLARGTEPSPSFRAMVNAAISAAVSQGGPGTIPPRSLRYGGRGLVKGPFGGPLTTGEDAEADIRSDQQLGTNRANVRRFRSRLAGTEGIVFDLEGLVRTLERGGLRNIAREEKTGQLHELSPRGNTPGELQESDLALRELRRRVGNRRFSLPGIENQLQFLKPQDIVQQIVQGIFGGETGTNILASPEVQRTISQAIRQGATNKPFNFLGGESGATRLGGKSVEASAREVLRLKQLVKENDQHMADVETRLESLAGSGRPTDRLEGTLNRLGLRGQRLRTELEAATPYTDRKLTSEERREYADSLKRANKASRTAIEGNVGLSPLEQALKEERSPETIARTIATKMREGILPAYETLIETISDSLEHAQPVEQGGRDPFAAGREAAVRSAHEGLSQAYGFTDESGEQVKGRGDDRQMFDALFKEALNEARATSFTQRLEGERSANLAHAGTGRGRIPKTEIGQRIDLTRTGTGGGAVQVPEYTRPTTSLDTERQGLGHRYDVAARAIAQRKFDESQAARKAGGVTKDFQEGFTTVEDFLRVPRVRKQGKEGQRSDRSTAGGYRPDIIAELESTTDVGKRIAEINRIQAAADQALKTAGPAIPLASGRKRSTADDRAARIKELGLDPAVEKEALEVLRQNARGQRTPYTKAGREVPTGDQTVERYAAAVEDRPVNKLAGGAGGGFAGAGGHSGGGGAFGGFPIPLPVLVVNDILRVSMEGGGGRRAASAASKAEDEAEAPASTIGGSSRLPKQLRYKRTPFEDPYSKLGTGKLQMVDKGIGVASTPITFLNDQEVALDRQRAREEARPEIEERKLLARQRRLRSQARVQDPVGYSAEQDVEDEQGKELRAQLRILGRRIPRRSFGASLTDLLSSIVPGRGSLEKQLEYGDLATREAAEIQRARTQRAQTRTTIKTLTGQIETARAAGQTPRAEQLTQVLREQQVAYKNQTAVIVESTKRFKNFYGEATRVSTVLRSFGAAAIGGAAAGGLGSLQFAAGAIIAQPIMQAFSALIDQVLAPALDQALGFPAAETQVVGGAAGLVRGAGGRADVAQAQLGLQTGNALTPSGVGGTVIKRADIEAGNQALAEQVGLIRAAIRVQQENKGAPAGDLALTQSLGGFLGGPLGGIPSIDEIIGKELKLNPQVLPTGQTPGQRQFIPHFGNAVGTPAPTGLSADQERDLATNLNGLNDILRKATGGIDKFTTSVGVSDDEIKKQADAFTLIGATNLAQAVHERRGALTENGKAVTDPARLVAILTAAVTNATKLSPEDFLAQQAPQIKAQQYLSRRQTQFNLEQAPIQEGLERSQQPLLPATGGFAPKDAARFKAELSGVQSIFDQLSKDAEQARTDAVKFFQTAVPGPSSRAAEDLGPAQVAPTGDAAAFAAALQKSAQYGKQIADIQLGVETAQAAFEARQYSVQIDLARRSLRDAKGLTGAITNDTKNLGVIERQQFDLQRQSQSLSLGMSQRQINFQRAIAGLAAPGLTGEERAARIEQAKIEADYAQKQLDIQKKLFGLGGRQFRITADRNVQDLTRQIGLLSEGREVSLRTAVATKQIQALTLLQARENKRVSIFYQQAVDATSQVMQLEAQLVANTEVGLNKVGNLVLAQFRKVYQGLIADLGGTYSSRSQEDTGQRHASGILGMASGPTALGIAGEAGNEAVAIIRNPRPYNGGGGGNTQIVIDLRGANVSGEEQMKKLTSQVQQAVERGLAQKGGLYGLS